MYVSKFRNSGVKKQNDNRAFSIQEIIYTLNWNHDLLEEVILLIFCASYDMKVVTTEWNIAEKKNPTYRGIWTWSARIKI